MRMKVIDNDLPDPDHDTGKPAYISSGSPLIVRLGENTMNFRNLEPLRTSNNCLVSNCQRGRHFATFRIEQ